MRLGIDFGTTRTVVAAVDRGNYPVLSFEAPDGSAHDWFPSLVAVRGEQRVYGWEAWIRQQEADWTVVRSLKRVMDDAGPRTRIEIGNQSIPLLQLLGEMARAIRAQLPHEKMEAMLGVPANANGNQRFLTTEAFRVAGFDVIGILNEPSAASIEYGHKNQEPGLLLVYDLGGGTFDASLVEMGDREHRVIVSEGIPTLGGDDFDLVLAEMAVGQEIYAGLDQSETFRLHEECRIKKEALHPNTRKIVLDLDAVREGLGTISIPIAEYYDRCRPMLDETVNLVEDMLASGNTSDLDALYVTGGGSELPLVGRVLKEKFGRRVKRSAHTRSATAIGLAIQSDTQAGYVLRDHFTRYFGVWREGDEGRNVTFDPLFPKGTPLPSRGEPALEISRYYCPVHNVGVFRYLECSHIDASTRPAGDITVWDEIRFPFDPQLDDIDETPVQHLDRVRHQTIEEKYVCDAGGAVTVTIRNDTAGYSRDYRLGRWAAKEAAITPGKPTSSRARSKTASHSRRSST
ncbi:MAG: Hsp70 family protein [Bryobacteraceae bacterium]